MRLSESELESELELEPESDPPMVLVKVVPALGGPVVVSVGAGVVVDSSAVVVDLGRWTVLVTTVVRV